MLPKVIKLSQTLQDSGHIGKVTFFGYLQPECWLDFSPYTPSRAEILIHDKHCSVLVGCHRLLRPLLGLPLPIKEKVKSIYN